MKLPEPFKIIIAIYGVTSPYAFHDELEAYVRDHLRPFLNAHWTENKIGRIVNLLAKNAQVEAADGERVPCIDPGSTSSVVDNILWNMDRGLYYLSPIYILWNWIWAEGYQKGLLKARVYPDAAESLKRWREEKFIRLYSIAAGESSGQRMFFTHSDQGDLSKVFQNYIEARREAKKKSGFFKILTQMLSEPNPKDILFISTELDELCAAQKAGLSVVCVKRSEGYGSNLPDDWCEKNNYEELIKKIPVVTSLDEIEFVEGNSKPCC